MIHVRPVPNEVLVIIIQCCGDLLGLCRTFLRLKECFNAILLDQRCDLFADYLYIRTDDPLLNNYYQSEVLRQLGSAVVQEIHPSLVSGTPFTVTIRSLEG